MGKKLVLALSIAVAALGTFLIFRKPKAPALGTGVETTRKDNFIFTRPVGVTEAPLLVVYGGLTQFVWARKEAMEQTVPNAIKLRACCIFFDHKGASLADAVAIGSQMCREAGIAVTDIKAMGFSAGAIPVQNGLGVPGVSFIGLIDPSTRAEFASGNFGDRGRMLYNAANWGTYPTIKAAMPKVAARIEQQGGQAKELPLRHSAFPKVFFETYEQELVTPKPFAAV